MQELDLLRIGLDFQQDWLSAHGKENPAIEKLYARLVILRYQMVADALHDACASER